MLLCVVYFSAIDKLVEGFISLSNCKFRQEEIPRSMTNRNNKPKKHNFEFYLGETLTRKTLALNLEKCLSLQLFTDYSINYKYVYYEANIY